MPVKLNPVTLLDSSYHDLSSTINSQTYRVFVGGIRASHAEPSPRPLVFVLDGNWLFASVYEYLRVLSIFEPSFGDPLVVGLGHPTDEVNTLLQLRDRDMAPLHGNINNVDQFLSFICGDVLIFLQTELSIVPGRKILAGHSWGGTFPLYAMGANKSGFDGYLASSPAILGTVLENIDEYIHNMPLTKETKLFTSVGSDEGLQFPEIIEGFPHLEKALAQHAPENLSYRSIMFEDENHSSITMAALSKGLRYLLA